MQIIFTLTIIISIPKEIIYAAHNIYAWKTQSSIHKIMYYSKFITI